MKSVGNFSPKKKTKKRRPRSIMKKSKKTVGASNVNLNMIGMGLNTNNGSNGRVNGIVGRKTVGNEIGLGDNSSQISDLNLAKHHS